MSLTAVALACAWGAAAHAQIIRGTLTDSATHSPLPGAIVVLLDAQDSVVARALSNEHGEFLLRSATAGQYRMRTLRIGYRPSAPRSIVLGSTTDTSVALRLAGIPYSLAAVRVTGRGDCRIKPDSGAEIARVWEAARTALTATSLSADQKTLHVLLNNWWRTYDGDAKRLVKDSVFEFAAFSAKPFGSAPPAVLADGWIQNDRDGATFYAPDAEILLTDFFAEGHCLYLTERARSVDGDEEEIDLPSRVLPVATTGLLGLAFEPSGRRRGIDVAGVLWINRATSELVSLEYQYTSVPRVMADAGAGGRVDFRRLRTGAWIIPQWVIRMPIPGYSHSRRRQSIDRIETTGGSVITAVGGRDTLWSSPSAVVRGVVVEEESGRPVIGAEVRLEGTATVTHTNPDGAFAIDSVLPRSYHLLASSPVMDSLGIPARGTQLDVTRHGRAITIRMPTGAALVRSSCDSVAEQRPGLVAGTLRDSAGRAVANDTVIVEWAVVVIVNGGLGARIESLAAETSATGQWMACGVPTDFPLRVRVARAPATSAIPVRIPPGHFYQVVNVVRSTASLTKAPSTPASVAP